MEKTNHTTEMGEEKLLIRLLQNLKEKAEKAYQLQPFNKVGFRFTVSIDENGEVLFSLRGQTGLTENTDAYGVSMETLLKMIAQNNQKIKESLDNESKGFLLNYNQDLGREY